MSKKFKKILAGAMAICMLAGSMSAALAAEDGTIRIEGEWYQGTNTDLFVKQSNSSASAGYILDVKVVDATGVDFDKYLFEYGVCVEKEGFYTITLASYSTTVPAAKLFVNGEEAALTVSGGNATATAKLKAGENILGVKVYKGVWNGTKDVVSFILDYIDITRVNEAIVIKKEAEDYDSTANGKKFTSNNWETMENISGNNGARGEATVETSFVYTVTAPESGEYKFLGRNQFFNINPYVLEVNGKSYNVNSSTAVQTATNANGGSVALYDSSLTEKVVLNKGTNTIKIIPNMRSTQKDYWLAMDYMTFEYVGAAAGVSAETVYEVQTVSTLNTNNEEMVVANATNANGGSFVGFDGHKTIDEPVSFTSKINIAEAGTYALTFVYGGRTDSNASELKVNINDEKNGDDLVYTTLTGSTGVDLDKKFNDLYWGSSSRFDGLNMYEYTWILDLPVGDTKINVQTYKRSFQGDYFAAYDCYKLKKIGNLDKVEISVADNFLAENATATAAVVALDTNGASVAEDATITYSSDNENIATVDADGKITAHNPGNASITATVSYKGIENVTKSASTSITVYGEQGVVVLGAKRSEKTVTVRISSVAADKTGTLQLWVAHYGTEGGELTSLKEIKKIDNSGYLPTIVQEARATLDMDVAADDAIRVFCWAGGDLVTPCFAALDVK